MNTETQTTVTAGYPEAGPFETESEAMLVFMPSLEQMVLSVERRDDGWYRTYVVSSTTSIIIAGYPEVGPFESEAAACAAALKPRDEPFAAGATILSVRHRADGWYKIYAISTTSTVYPYILDTTRGKLKIRCLFRLPFYIFGCYRLRNLGSSYKRGIQIILFGYVFNLEW